MIIMVGMLSKKKENCQSSRHRIIREYKIDSALAENTLIWAVDNGISQAAIDTLKPMLRNLDSLALNFRLSFWLHLYLYTLFDIGLEYEIIDQYDSAYPYLQKSYEHQNLYRWKGNTHRHHVF